MTVRRVAVLVAVLAVLVVGAVLAVVFAGTEVTGRPTAREYDDGIPDAATAAICRSQGDPAQVVVYFSDDAGDAGMQSAAEALADDERFETVEQETKQQAYLRFLEVFADDPEMLELVTPDSLPASLWLTPAGDVTSTALLTDLKDELTGPEIDSLDISCRSS